MITIKTAVRNLVEFILRRGDLQTGVTGLNRAQDGIKAHQYIQNSRKHNYLPEVSLCYSYRQEDFCLEIKGRADGIINKETHICIDEIKTTTLDLDMIEENFNELHWAQAQCYAFMYAQQESLERMEVQLTYYQLDSKEIKTFSKLLSYEELSIFFLNLVNAYLKWASNLQEWAAIRNFSINELQFPFDYRHGQREMVIAVYKTIKEGQKLYIQAPTGIGKTIGTIFPTLKALAEGLTTQVFYLTAKTIARTVAEKTLADLQMQGLKLKRLTLTAKDKLCFLPEASCIPDECAYAKGYYDRLKSAVEELFTEEAWTRERVEYYAHKYTVCPFEFSLEMSKWADVIICDYNYVFDPKVYLRRLFLENEDYTFLVDEAHNLVDRAREMFSAVLSKSIILDLKRLIKDDAPGITKSLTKINNALNKLKKSCLAVNGELIENDLPYPLIQALSKYTKEAESYLQRSSQVITWQERFLEFYFMALGFLRTSESFDEHYITYSQITKQEDFEVKLFCIDPSLRLREALERGNASILFSATLSPMEYFMSVLGGSTNSYKLLMHSPFPKENLCLLINDQISTKYKKRQETYTDIVKAITAAVEIKVGNYLVFLPSYEYLIEISCRFREANEDKIRVINQSPGMTELEREAFLANFIDDCEETLVGFALMGGLFGEGIDLIGDRLSGAVIVGVGLPQICFEREIIRSYYAQTRKQGFEFAYLFPGFNKVLQAVGRVIRTEQDRGIVLLIDERFSQIAYKRLYPKDWPVIQYARNPKMIKTIIGQFWKNN